MTLAASALLTSTANAALTPPTEHSRFHLGIIASGGYMNSQADASFKVYNADSERTAQTNYNDHISNHLIAAGAELGYTITQLNDNEINLAFQYNYLHSNLTENFAISSNDTPSGEGFEAKDKLQPRAQFNFLLGFKHFLSPTLEYHAAIGASALTIKDALSLEADDQSNAVGASSTQRKTVFGGMLSVGFGFYLSQHAEITTNATYALYNNINLKDSNTIDTSDSERENKLQDRKYSLSIPAVSIGYNYYF